MTKERILDFLKERKKYLESSYHIEKIGIFGSYSRGDYNEQSDVDIVYQLKDSEKFGYFEYQELAELLSGEFRKKVELVNYRYMNPIVRFKARKEIIYV